MSTVLVIGSIVAAAAVAALGAVLFRAYWRSRGPRLVTCPETGDAVGVEIDHLNAALGHGPTLQSCTRWPERADCGQECLAQIGSSPNGCSVRAVVGAWYEGKSCAACGKPFGPVHAWDHQPAVVGTDGVTREWPELSVPEIPEILATHSPICWDCHVVATLYRKHPELVVERPFKDSAMTPGHDARVN